MTTPPTLAQVRTMAEREAKKRRQSKDKARLFVTYWDMLGPLDLQPVAEYEFSAVVGRRHRFDYCFPVQKVAVEIEGNAWKVRGGGRHMRDADLEKYNLAAALGYRVFRFSPAMIERDPHKCIDQVAEALKPPTRKAGIR
jgi:very-short-patch-repair endonuclease